MKLLSVSLLLVLAFAAGILFYRAALDVPAPAVAPTGPEPDHSSRIVLANNADGDEPIALVDASEPTLELLRPDEPGALDVVAVAGQSEPGLEFNVAAPGPADTLISHVASFDVQVAEPQPSTFDIELAEAPVEDSFDLPVAPPQLQTFDVEIADSLAEANEPPTTTIEAVPEGSRVRIESAEGSIIEADSVSLFADAKPQASAGSGTTPGSNADNPIPEFLRGQQLPPLIAGQKVVTIQVPVENWVDLGWGDIVRVEREMHGVGIGSDAGVSGTIDLTSLERVEIYALPQFAPENADTVAVCLKVNSQQARQLLQYRRAEGTFTLTVVQKFVPTPVYEHDEFPVPVRQPDPVPNDSTNLVPTQLPTDASAGTPADVPVYGRTSDFDLNPKTYVEPESHSSSNDFAPPEPAPNPVDSPVPVYESNPRPDDDFDPDPVAQSQPQPDSSPDDILDLTISRDPDLASRDSQQEDSLPAIEPSESGTVHRLDGEGRFTIDAGESLLLAAPGELKFLRVSGFDTRLIRVTAQSPYLLKVEGVTGGRTAMIVECSDRVIPPFSVQIEVVAQHDADLPVERTPTAAEWERAAQQRDEQTAHEHVEIVKTLHDLYPEADLKITWIRDSILLRGTVPNPDVQREISEVAEQYAPKVLNQLRVGKPEDEDAFPSDLPEEGIPQSYGVQIPPDMRVVVVTNADVRQVRSRPPGTQVDVYRIRVVPRGNAPSEVYYEPFIEDIALLGTHVTFASAALLVNEKQATALEESFDKILSWHVVPRGIQPVNGSIPIDAAGAPVFNSNYEELEPGETQAPPTYHPPTYAPRSQNEYSQQPAETLGSRSEPGRVEDNDSNTSLRADIRALHDDVRKLIALLEQRMSDSDAHDVENFEPPLNPSPGSADDAPSESEPAEEAPVPESGDEGEPDSEESVTEFQQRLWDEVGLRVTRLPEWDPRLKGHPYRGGLLIGDVRPGSPFALVGAQTGDILVGLHVWETVSDESLQYVLDHRDGDQGAVKFYLVREGETRYGHVTLQGWPAMEKPEAAADPAADDVAVPVVAEGSAAQRRFINEWGRAMLRRQYRRALLIAAKYQSASHDNWFYTECAEASQSAIAAGSSTTPLLVVAGAKWAAPYQAMSPLVDRLQDWAKFVVVLDADADAELFEQLKITSVPTLLWTVDGEKSFEAVGVTNIESIRDFYHQRSQLPNLDEYGRPVNRLLKFPNPGYGRPLEDAVDRVTRVELPTALQAFDSVESDTFSFHVGFMR